ncbi:MULTISPECIES: GNAT family N-acetyltransferase [unclassified Microbacterium]|uniref:GNAT family N-acetyltransferase n=1 Tax=unclassified Microbacterium TaxID=2609290 RepID=UPI000EA8FFF1|nr:MULTISPECIES: GNAT family N-acetyltransferase [unclassified Microbacterium]MBT2484464.1 GNAT family N-acetyltransferase [Microbacterium sp. ISL-108]RKN67370.1 GNAT family N-acetyltransferase [Microbacterium sp. CGR2]
MTIDLIRPTTDLFDSWAEAVAEFGDLHIDGSGLQAPVTPDRATLDALIEKATLFADTTVAPPEGLVHNDLYWIVVDDEVIGFLSFRHTLNDWLREAGGHIGYAVRSSHRRQGYATAALALGLERAREIGLDRVFVTCDDDNVASARTIEKAGGVLQDVSDQSERGHAMLRRYWIEL